MAINTPKPISRDERYLSKIGGNEEVIVPKPISREEKYMYRAAGYDDQPIPDYPISRKEKYWAKIIENGGGSEIGSTVTFDSGQKFISDNSSFKDYKIYGNGGEIHPTGVLPLTFTAKGGNMADWVIEGNDDNGTENLFQTTATSSSGGGFIFAVNNDGSITVTGTPTLSTTYFFVLGQFSVPAGTYTITGCPNGGSWGGSNPQTYCSSVQVAGIGTLYETGDGVTVTAQSETTIKLIITLSTSLSNIDLTYKPMVVKGSTAPDHYIPYQKGVGERTAQLWNKDDLESGAIDPTTGQDIGGSTFLRTAGYIEIEIGESYYMTAPDGGVRIFEYAADKSYIGSYIHNRAKSLDQGANTKYIRSAAIGTYFPDSLMLVKGSTAPSSYIPYGYQIPLTVESGETENLWNEDNKLTDYMLRTNLSQGTDLFAYSDYFVTNYIRLKAGMYTLSVASQTATSANVEYIRANVYSLSKNFIANVVSDALRKSNGQYQFEISEDCYFRSSMHNGTTATLYGVYTSNIPIYIGTDPLTEGETVSKTSTGVDIELFEGENTISTTLYNKPSMEIETSYGVGVKDNNHYIIPFKVNTTIYNIQIGDSPLYDGEYLSYKEKKLYKYIDSVLIPIDPPSPFPEISTTEGVNKVIIETSTQPDSIFITTQNPIKLVQPNIGTKTITQNGVYNASDDNLDGYSSVTVNTN